jgi:putative PIN family toxin of toxin-antitoxin system
MSHKPAYIVIDTNVLISAGLLPQSTTAQALAVAVTHFVIAQNEDTWHELETRIARPKFDRYFGEFGRLRHLIQIAQSAAFFEVTAQASISRDKTDDKFLALAIRSCSQAGSRRLLFSGAAAFNGEQTVEGDLRADGCLDAVVALKLFAVSLRLAR